MIYIKGKPQESRPWEIPKGLNAFTAVVPRMQEATAEYLEYKERNRLYARDRYYAKLAGMTVKQYRTSKVLVVNPESYVGYNIENLKTAVIQGRRNEARSA